MSRIVKNRDERLEEIFSAAQTLFAQFGYDSVSVQKIIDRVGIAKGTFYHYFKSKEELLDAMVHRFSQALIADLDDIVSDDSLAADQKLSELMIQGTKAKLSGSFSEFLKIMVAVMANPANSLLVQKIMVSVERSAVPLYANIIEQGVREGVFAVDLYEETALMLIAISKSLQEKFQAVFMLSSRDEIIAEFERLMHFFELSVERLLGASPGTLQFVTPELGELMHNFCSNLSTIPSQEE